VKNCAFAYGYNKKTAARSGCFFAINTGGGSIVFLITALPLVLEAAESQGELPGELCPKKNICAVEHTARLLVQRRSAQLSGDVGLTAGRLPTIV
jgi:hypothetical protein